MPTIEDILDIDSRSGFEEKALELFAYQSERCEPYREYLRLMEIDPEQIVRSADIPHLPIEFFRTRKVYSGSSLPEKVFTSSTTGGDKPSCHYVAKLEDYRKTFDRAFSLFYGSPSDWSFYCLLPGYLEREGSSLVYMADNLIKQGGGGFFLNDYDNLLNRMAADPRKKVLLGVSYALLDLAEKYSPDLTGTVVMETGGMKGRRKELPKDEFHKILCSAFGVSEIHSEYGMAELSSQAYSAGGGIFRCPPWMRFAVRDVSDPFESLPHGRKGGVNITDLANINSCAFIQTDDLGLTAPDGSFSILGRIDHSQLRGCNLLVD